MNTIYEYTNVSASERLESFFENKVQLLTKKYPFITRADVFFKKENKSEEDSQNCGVRLSVPGPRLYASTDAASFEEAITETLKNLSVQLEKKKSTFNAHQN